MDTFLIVVTIEDSNHDKCNIPYLVIEDPKTKPKSDRELLDNWLDKYFGEKTTRDQNDDMVWSPNSTRSAMITKCQRIFDQERFLWFSKQSEGYIETVRLT